MRIRGATLAAGLFLACGAPAGAQDWCALFAHEAPAVFGTPLQAAPQCDESSAAANNRTGSDRLAIYVASMPGSDMAVESVRDDAREGRTVTDEPSLGKTAILVRGDEGREATFHISDGARYVTVYLRARDGLDEAYVERARRFATLVLAAK